MHQYFKMLSILALFFIPSLSQSAMIQDVSFPDTLTTNGKKLVLNGLGVRTKKVVFVKIKVYAAGLYLEEKSNQRESILNDGKLKRLDMQFLHDVSKEKLIHAWKEAFENNCESSKLDCKQVPVLLDKINPIVDEAKVGDRIQITFLPSDVVVKYKDQPEKIITGGSDFSKIMLSAWFGKTPPDEDLLKGLLGEH